MTKNDTLDKHDEVTHMPVRRATDWGDLVDRLLGEWPRSLSLSELRRNLVENNDMMKVEEFTEGSELVVRAEMPGIDPDRDVQITITDHTLHLEAERRQEHTIETDRTRRSEFRYGSFARSVRLPAGAADDDVKATYKDGVLEVRIPVDTDDSKRKQVPVHRI